MAKGFFETPFEPGSAYLGGEIQAYVHEHGGVDPRTIIRVDTDWSVHIKWKLTGSLVPLICGEWCVHAYLESMGPGPELKLHDQIGPWYLPLDPCGDGKYEYHFDVRKGAVKAAHCSTPYKLVVAITYLNKCRKPGPMAAFVEGPILQFYDPSS